MTRESDGRFRARRSSLRAAPSTLESPHEPCRTPIASTFSPPPPPNTMSFAILGASAALVPNRVRVAKNVNNTRVSTVTVAVRHACPAPHATSISIPIPLRVALSFPPSARLRTARAARDARLDGRMPCAFSRSARKPTWRGRFAFLDHFPFFVTGFAGAADPKNVGSAFREKAKPPGTPARL